MTRATQIAFGLVLGLAAGLGAALYAQREAASPSAVPEWQTHFSSLARRVAPGVVNVHTSRTISRTYTPDLPFPNLDRFFGLPGPQAEEQSEAVPSLGSGFLISADGLIVTNDHIVDGVDRITVIFNDGREADAEIVGRDPKTDIALVRVAMSGLQPLELGDSNAVQPGDWVVAIGNPFGLDHTVTVGIVSAKGREIGTGPYDDYIQTDAAINPGNSGGPLLDLQGRVVGINTAINPIANTIGFAVPINIAKTILPQLERDGRVTRGWLGAGVQRITPEIAEAFGLPSRAGALVAQVTPGGPADRGGLRRGDVVLSIDGRDVQDIREIPRAVSNAVVGSTVRLGILREARRLELPLVVSKLEEPELPELASAGGGARDYGLRVEALNLTLRQRLGLREPGGVVIAEVEPGGAADTSGLRLGDVLLEVDRQRVRDPAHLDAVLGQAQEGVLVLAQRGRHTVFVPLGR